MNRLSNRFVISCLALLPVYPLNAAEPDHSQLARGLLLKHEDRLILSPCRQKSYENVEDVSSAGVVTQTLTTFGLTPDKPLYVELFGHYHDSVLSVAAINFAHTSARCMEQVRDGYEWRAVGLEADWQLALGEGNLRIEQREQEAILLNYEQLAVEGESYRLSAPVSAGTLGLTQDSTLELRFIAASCRSSDASFLSGWQAELSVGEQTWHGCAWQS